MSYDSIRTNFVFNTQNTFIQDSYQPEAAKKQKGKAVVVNRKVDMSDGILFSIFACRTEAEWEYAAYAIISNKEGFVEEGKIYPWSGTQMRNPQKKQRGQMQANL